jgi:hypothetical protein
MDDVYFISSDHGVGSSGRSYSFFNENGDPVNDKSLSYAYKVVYTRQSPRYFIYLDRNGIVDPHRSSGAINRSKFISTKVSEDCFNSYVEYLRTKKRGYILLARRKLDA